MVPGVVRLGPRRGLLWVTDRPAYGLLARRLRQGCGAAPKGECLLTFNDVAAHAEGLLAGVPLHRATAADVQRYRSAFSDRCYAVAELHRGANDKQILRRMVQTGREARVLLVAANGVHYHVRELRPLQDVLAALCHGFTVAELVEGIFPNVARYLKSPSP